MTRYSLTESRLRGMIREAVKSVLYENSFAGTVDALVKQFKPLYNQYKKIGNEIETEFELFYMMGGSKENLLNKLRSSVAQGRKEQYKLLSTIANGVNSALNDEILDVSWGTEYDEHAGYYDGPFLTSAMYYEDDPFVSDFLESLRGGTQYSVLSRKRQAERDARAQEEFNTKKQEQDKQLQYWSDRGLDVKKDDLGGIRLNRGNGASVPLPKMVGKITLPPESPKATAKRSRALRK